MGRKGALNHKAHHVCSRGDSIATGLQGQERKHKHKLDEWIWGYKSCIAIPECTSWHLSQKSHRYEPPNYPSKAAQIFLEIPRLHNWMCIGIKANKIIRN